MLESRTYRRKPMLKQGVLSANEDDGGFACVIRDASRYGCRVFCQQLAALPDTVYLRTKGVDGPIKCHLAWRVHTCAGLRFL